MQVDGEQMDNVSSAIVLQLMMNLRLQFVDWGFVFQEGLKELCHRIITWLSGPTVYLLSKISVRNNCFV